MSRSIGHEDLNRPPTNHVLTLSDRSVEQLDQWRLDAISALVLNDDPEPITSLTNCLVTLIRFSGSGYAESDSLIVVDTPIGLQVGLHRDRKGVCSLNS